MDSKPSGSRRSRSPPFPPSSSRAWPHARAELGDVGENAPEHWEKPLGSQDVHLVMAGLAPDAVLLEAAFRYARDALRDLSGVVPVWQLEVQSAADLRNMFGFADGISHPAVEGTGIPGTESVRSAAQGGRVRPGVRGRDLQHPPNTEPEVLGRNGTYAVFRKLYTRVSCLPPVPARARQRPRRGGVAGRQDRRALAQRAPLALTPEKDDPELGADPKRNNAFMFGDDPRGLKSPIGAHVRRMNPRDSVVIGAVRLHRMIRRGTNYGQPLPPGVMEDDGADRGLLFAFVGAHLDRQFEFIQREWVNDGKFIGAPAEKDPLVSSSDGREFTIPNQPIRRHLKGLPAFVVNRGGEYCFMPGLRALALARRSQHLSLAQEEWHLI